MVLEPQSMTEVEGMDGDMVTWVRTDEMLSVLFVLSQPLRPAGGIRGGRQDLGRLFRQERNS